MSIISAKCSECGAPIEVNSEQKEGFCPFCGTKYITQDIVQKIIQNNFSTTYIQSAVIKNNEDLDTLYERFEAFINLGYLSFAEKVAKSMQEKFPQKSITWYCLALCAAANTLHIFLNFKDKFQSLSSLLDCLTENEDLKQNISEENKNISINELRESLDNLLKIRTKIESGIKCANNFITAAHKLESKEENSRYFNIIQKTETSLEVCKQQFEKMSQQSELLSEIITKKTQYIKQNFSTSKKSKTLHRILFAIIAIVLIAIALTINFLLTIS